MICSSKKNSDKQTKQEYRTTVETKTLLKKGKNYTVRCEIGGQKAKFQIPDLFPDVKFPNQFHLKEDKILIILKKKFTLLPIWGAEKSAKQYS